MNFLFLLQLWFCRSLHNLSWVDTKEMSEKFADPLLENFTKIEMISLWTENGLNLLRVRLSTMQKILNNAEEIVYKFNNIKNIEKARESIGILKTKVLNLVKKAYSIRPNDEMEAATLKKLETFLVDFSHLLDDAYAPLMYDKRSQLDGYKQLLEALDVEQNRIIKDLSNEKRSIAFLNKEKAKVAVETWRELYQELSAQKLRVEKTGKELSKAHLKVLQSLSVLLSEYEKSAKFNQSLSPTFFKAVDILRSDLWAYKQTIVSRSSAQKTFVLATFVLVTLAFFTSFPLKETNE